MKKLLLSIVIVLIAILTGITVVQGLHIGGLNVLGIVEIKNENNDLDTIVKQATKLASTDYQKKKDDLDDAIKKLETEKNNYEDMVNVSTESEVEAANQSYDYEIDFLLIRIENHAKSEGVTMKMDVTKSSSGAENVYNLNFTATGSYIGVSDFISNIEDDSKLGFKIEDFKMAAASTENTNQVQAIFVCKNISIDGILSSSNDTITINETKTIDTKNTTTGNNTVQ